MYSLSSVLQRNTTMQIANVRTFGGIAKFIAANPNHVYCGRPSPLGNPFAISPNRTREQAIDAYRRWLHEHINDAAVDAALEALTHDSVLGCWCHPLPCHCAIIIKAWQWRHGQCVSDAAGAPGSGNQAQESDSL
jgi:hypothetical protein